MSRAAPKIKPHAADPGLIGLLVLLNFGFAIFVVMSMVSVERMKTANPGTFSIAEVGYMNAQYTSLAVAVLTVLCLDVVMVGYGICRRLGKLYRLQVYEMGQGVFGDIVIERGQE